jgi:prepilin-type processing-associated H-X9-DG protein
MALLLPAVQKVRESANRMLCASNLRQLAIAVHAFENDHQRLPYNTQGYEDWAWSWKAQSHQRSWSWLARLLPYIEQENLYRLGNIPQNTFAQSQAVLATPVPLFFCPSDNARAQKVSLNRWNLEGQPIALTNYKGVSGSNWCWIEWRHVGHTGQCDGLHFGDGMFWRDDHRAKLKLTSVTDGTSNTFMIGEDIPEKNTHCSWPYANNAVGTCGIGPNSRQLNGQEYHPENWYGVYSFRSRHADGLQFAYADGSVRLVKNSISLQLYRALATIRGGEVAAEE